MNDQVPPQSGSRSSSRDALSELVVQCLERMEKEGTAAIDRICEEHPDQSEALRAQLENLARMGLLDDPHEEQPESELPERLGEFRVLRRLGGGGMGVVYLAEQESLKREVALKLIRPEHLYFPKARARFVREIEAIARLSHPGIVQVFAAGEAQKIPYFAMEVVDGISMQRAFDAFSKRDPRDLTGRELVKLVLGEDATDERIDRHPWAKLSWIVTALTIVKGIGEALAHAHSHDMLHRDIKPSNVMLTTDGRAVLLDFGLATTSGASRLTVTGSVLGSIYYMTPEQISGRGDAIDVRADVWGLGVVLYELLTLRLPFAGDDVETVRQRILFEEPMPLRERNSAISWDAETVCLCALEKVSAQRYATMDAFVRDLRNVLELLPIEARRAGLPRRVIRWTQRHPAKATAIALAFVVLVLGPLVVTAVVLNRNAEIQARADELEEMFQFQKDMLTSIQPGDQGRDVKVATMLENASKTVGARFEGQPMVEAPIRSLLCETWLSLGELDEADVHATRAVELFDEAGVGDGENALIAQARLGQLRSAQGRNDEARRLLSNAANRLEEKIDDDDPRVASIRIELANLCLEDGSRDEAEIHARRALECLEKALRADEREITNASATLDGLRKLHGEGHAKTLGATFALEAVQKSRGENERMALAARGLLTQVLYYRGDYKRAEEEGRKVVDAKSKAIGPSHPNTLVAKQTLAVILDKNGKSHEAVELSREIAGEQERQLGPDHAHFLATLNTLASFLDSIDELEECESLRRKVLESRQRVLGPEHPDTIRSKSSLANTLFNRNKMAEARVVAEEAAEAATRVIGHDRLETLIAVERLGDVCRIDRRDSEGLKYYDQAIEGALSTLGKEHPTTCSFRQDRAASIVQLGRLDEAIAELRDVEAILQKTLGADHVNALNATARVGGFYLKEKQFDDALPHLDRAIEGAMQTLGEEHLLVCEFRQNRAKCLARLGRHELAIAEFAEVQAIYAKNLGPDHLTTLRAFARFGSALAEEKLYEDALKYFDRATEGATRTIGKDNLDSCEFRDDRAKCLAQIGRHDEAIAEILDVQAIFEKGLGPDRFDTLSASASCGEVFVLAKRFDEALPHFDRAIDGAIRTLGKEYPVTCEFRQGRAACLAHLGRFDEAIVELLDVETKLEARFGLPNFRTQAAVAGLDEVFTLAGKPDEAEQWRAKAIGAKQ